MKHQNADGTFNHFEMKGGPFAGWLKDLHELQCRAERSSDVFQEMDTNDINGTAIVPSLLDDIATKTDKLLENMKSYRREMFKE
jgi:hypothetical protein